MHAIQKLHNFHWSDLKLYSSFQKCVRIKRRCLGQGKRVEYVWWSIGRQTSGLACQAVVKPSTVHSQECRSPWDPGLDGLGFLHPSDQHWLMLACCGKGPALGCCSEYLPLMHAGKQHTNKSNTKGDQIQSGCAGGLERHSQEKRVQGLWRKYWETKQASASKSTPQALIGQRSTSTMGPKKKEKFNEYQVTVTKNSKWAPTTGFLFTHLYFSKISVNVTVEHLRNTYLQIFLSRKVK